MSELKKGDIVINRFAGDRNPLKMLVYLGKSSCKQGSYSHKTYDCLAYDGRKIQIFRENNPLVYVGHMEEFDSFVEALKKLKDGRNDPKRSG